DCTFARHLSVARLAPGRLSAGEHVGTDAGDLTIGGEQLADPMSKEESEPAICSRPVRRGDERREDAWAGPPGDVEAGNSVPMPAGEVTATLGPLDEGEPPHPEAMQPFPHRTRREFDILLRPRVPVAVRALAVRGGGIEPGGPAPVGERELWGVLHPQPPLLRGVDEEEPTEGPPRLAAERGSRVGDGDGDAAHAPGEVGGGSGSAESRAYNNDIRISHGTTLSAAAVVWRGNHGPRRE